MGIYEAPRKVLGAIAGLELVEMERHGSEAVCCGSSQWLNCTSATKQLQIQRLREAHATGAQTLVTACPKCRIHLSCTLRDIEAVGAGLKPAFSLEIMDLTNLVAESMINEGPQTN
jgi:Fe-S oxidoreductase